MHDNAHLRDSIGESYAVYLDGQLKLISSQTLESLYPVAYHGPSTWRSLHAARKQTKLFASLREHVGIYTTPPPADSYTALWLGPNWNMPVTFGLPTP